MEQYIGDITNEDLRTRLDNLNAALVRNPTTNAFQELMNATWDNDRKAMKSGVTKNMRARIVEYYASLLIDGKLRQSNVQSEFLLCDFRQGDRIVCGFEYDQVIRSATDGSPRAAVECKTWLDANMLFSSAAKSYVLKKRLPGVRCYLLTGEECKSDLAQKFPEVAEWQDGPYALGSEYSTAGFLDALTKCLGMPA